jgi:hypothetical protein
MRSGRSRNDLACSVRTMLAAVLKLSCRNRLPAGGLQPTLRPGYSCSSKGSEQNLITPQQGASEEFVNFPFRQLKFKRFKPSSGKNARKWTVNMDCFLHVVESTSAALRALVSHSRFARSHPDRASTNQMPLRSVSNIIEALRLTLHRHGGEHRSGRPLPGPWVSGRNIHRPSESDVNQANGS